MLINRSKHSIAGLMTTRGSFTPKQVGRALGVSEASVKRWCDRGLIAAERTGGGHRRILLASVIRFLRQEGRPLVSADVLGLPAGAGDSDRLVLRGGSEMFAALESGDEDRAHRAALNLYLGGRSVTQICDEELASSFHRLGVGWEHGETEVYQERRACEICHHLLYGFRGFLPSVSPDAPLALGGTLSDDPYALATAMVEVCLRENGWMAESYGTGLPGETFAAAIRHRRPRLVWLSVSSIASEAAFLRQYETVVEAVEELGVALVVGGRALDDALRREMSYATFCQTFAHVVSFATSFLPSSSGRVSAA